MMQPLTSKLPREQWQRLHTDFLANEQNYLRLRDGLLASHRGQWVAVQEGRVIAAGNDLMTVMRAAADSGGHPFVARVGEEETSFRVRRVEFAYDQADQPLPIPRATVTFWNDAETHRWRGKIVARRTSVGHEDFAPATRRWAAPLK